MEIYNLNAKLIGDFWFSVADMPFPGSTMGAATIKLAKRYPSSGYAALSSDMLVLILEGRCYLKKAKEETVYLMEGDVVTIRKGEEYCWTPLGVQPLKIFAVNSPPFDEKDRLS